MRRICNSQADPLINVGTEQMTGNNQRRRDTLWQGLGGVFAAAVGSNSVALAQVRARKRSLRFAHLTDVHLGPTLDAAKGFAACLAQVQSLADPPEFIMTGGDDVYDAFGSDKAATAAQWKLWSALLKAHCNLPLEHCIGNRDIWGWDRKKSNTRGTEPLWGKAWALDALGLDRSYRSFDRGGWHFVVLDSIGAIKAKFTGEGFQARLDDDQFEWFATDLAANRNKHTLVVSHAPIMSACVYLDGPYEKSGDWVVPGAWMHIDARRIVDLFLSNPQVRACISGHIHQVDRVDYQGVSYFCNGAVCGDWWKGPNLRCDCGYALVDLYDDGVVESNYRTYGWKYAHAAAQRPDAGHPPLR